MLSAVIPTLNAAATLPTVLDTLRAEGVDEIVVSDGGSIDATEAAATGCVWRIGPRGRGGQLRRGAEAARGDWLLFLHADTRPAPGWRAAVDRFIAGGSSRAGYFDFRLDADAPQAKRLEQMVAWRCRRLTLPYGDQGLLIARALYDALGGYPDQPLMEDVAIIRRLGRARLAPIGWPAVTSAAKFKGRYWRRSVRNLSCLALYFLGLPPARIARLYA